MLNITFTVLFNLTKLEKIYKIMDVTNASSQRDAKKLLTNFVTNFVGTIAVSGKLAYYSIKFDSSLAKLLDRKTSLLVFKNTLNQRV